MAERAALIQRQESGRWRVYHSQWGGTDRALSAVCAGIAPSSLPVSWEHDRSVGRFRVAVAGLDYLGIELFYREQKAPETFLVLWFGLPLETSDSHLQAGAAVEIHSLQDARRRRTAFRRMKRRLADALATGAIPASTAPFVLLGSIRRLEGRELYAVWRGTESSNILYTKERPPDL